MNPELFRYGLNRFLARFFIAGASESRVCNASVFHECERNTMHAELPQEDPAHTREILWISPVDEHNAPVDPVHPREASYLVRDQARL
jgi:hypothetical protein